MSDAYVDEMLNARRDCSAYRLTSSDQVNFLKFRSFRRAWMSDADKLNERCSRVDRVSIRVGIESIADHCTASDWKLGFGSLTHQSTDAVATRK